MKRAFYLAVFVTACYPPVQSGVSPIDGCTSDSDCPHGYHCAPGVGGALVGNACQLFPRSCRVDEQCDPGQSCQNGSCLPADRAFCQPCDSSADCAAGGVCVTAGPDAGGGACSEPCDTCPSGGACEMVTDGSGNDAGFTCLPTVSACGGNQAATFTFINQNLFQGASCTTCHAAGAGKVYGSLDLVTDPYGALVNVAAVNSLGSATGLTRVAPGNPAQSFLLIKLQLTGNDPQYGEAMPPQHGGTPASLVQAVQSWIEAGAPNN